MVRISDFILKSWPHPRIEFTESSYSVTSTSNLESRVERAVAKLIVTASYGNLKRSHLVPYTRIHPHTTWMLYYYGNRALPIGETILHLENLDELRFKI